MTVALSRVTSLDNIYLVGSFTLSAIKAGSRAMWNEKQLSTFTTSFTSGNFLKIALLITRLLNKHGVDISKDNRLLQTDTLFLTETHVMPEQNITRKNCLDQFHFYHNKSTDKSESFAFVCTNSVDVVSHHQIPGKSFFSLKKLTFMEAQVNILLLYRKITTNLAGCYEHLREINFSQKI